MHSGAFGYGVPFGALCRDDVAGLLCASIWRSDPPGTADWEDIPNYHGMGLFKGVLEGL